MLWLILPSSHATTGLQGASVKSCARLKISKLQEESRRFKIMERFEQTKICTADAWGHLILFVWFSGQRTLIYQSQWLQPYVLKDGFQNILSPQS